MYLIGIYYLYFILKRHEDLLEAVDTVAGPVNFQRSEVFTGISMHYLTQVIIIYLLIVKYICVSEH